MEILFYPSQNGKDWQKATNAGKDLEIEKLSFTVGGSTNCDSHYIDVSVGNSLKARIKSPQLWFSLVYTSKECRDWCEWYRCIDWGDIAT